MITNFEDLNAFSCSEQINDYFFRGQSDSDWSLESTLQREFPKYQSFPTILDYEQDCINNYLKSNQDNHCTVWKLLAQMRHDGYPSRMLDFSKSLLVALYFAFVHNTETEVIQPNKRRIYFIRRTLFEKKPPPLKIDDLIHFSKSRENGITYSMFCLPKQNENERMTKQDGVLLFMVQPEINLLEKIEIDSNWNTLQNFMYIEALFEETKKFYNAGIIDISSNLDNEIRSFLIKEGNTRESLGF